MDYLVDMSENKIAIFSGQTLTLVLFILFMKMQANSLSPKWPEQRPVDCISFVPQLTEVLSIDLT